MRLCGDALRMNTSRSQRAPLLLTLYDQALTSHPLETRVATAASLAFAGDAVAQWFAIMAHTLRLSRYGPLNRFRSATSPATAHGPHNPSACVLLFQKSLYFKTPTVSNFFPLVPLSSPRALSLKKM